MAGIQILVVEDDAIQAKLVRFLLTEAGHTVEIAETAEKALEVLQSFRPDQMLWPDLILVDIQLPGKDGLELTRELRQTPIYDKDADHRADCLHGPLRPGQSARIRLQRHHLQAHRYGGLRLPGAEFPGWRNRS